MSYLDYNMDYKPDLPSLAPIVPCNECTSWKQDAKSNDHEETMKMSVSKPEPVTACCHCQ